MQAEEVQVILKTKEQREKEQNAATEPKTILKDVSPKKDQA